MIEGYNFDTRTTEFGICVESDEGEVYALVPVNERVKRLLIEMLETTKNGINELIGEDGLEPFSPSQKYGPKEALFIPIDNDINTKIKGIYEAENISVNPSMIEMADLIVFYFAIMGDSEGSKLLAVKRATYFRSISRHKVIRFIDDMLKLGPKGLFKLDIDYDYIATGEGIYILHPSGFEYTADIDEHILTAARENTMDVCEKLPFIDPVGLAEYVSTRKRAARLIASIHSLNNLDEIDRRMLESECDENGISLNITGDRIAPESGYEMAFLMLLDRRRFNIELIVGENEIYDAPNRRPVL